MDAYIVYNTEYQTIICRKHKYAISPKYIERHFREEHKDISLATRKSILNEIQMLELCDPIVCAGNISIRASENRGKSRERGEPDGFEGGGIPPSKGPENYIISDGPVQTAPTNQRIYVDKSGGPCAQSANHRIYIDKSESAQYSSQPITEFTSTKVSQRSTEIYHRYLSRQLFF